MCVARRRKKRSHHHHISIKGARCIKIIASMVHGDAIKDWRRGAEKVNEEESDGGKAGEGGPVVGGVALR